MDVQERMVMLIDRSALLKEIVTVEPRIVDMLLEAARMPPVPHTTRWHAYTDLKRHCDRFVGWGARDKRLSSCQHYEAFIQLIDALLPDEDAYYSEMQEEEVWA